MLSRLKQRGACTAATFQAKPSSMPASSSAWIRFRQASTIFLNLRALLLGDDHLGLGLAGNGVAHAAAVDLDQAHVHLLRRGLQGAGQDLDGVAAVLVDVQARVAALQAVDGHLAAGAVLGRAGGPVLQGELACPGRRRSR